MCHEDKSSQRSQKISFIPSPRIAQSRYLLMFSGQLRIDEIPVRLLQQVIGEVVAHHPRDSRDKNGRHQLGPAKIFFIQVLSSLHIEYSLHQTDRPSHLFQVREPPYLDDELAVHTPIGRPHVRMRNVGPGVRDRSCHIGK